MNATSRNLRTARGYTPTAGRTLNLEIVAEGVERGVQRDRLRLEQCDLAQGYLFARPMSAAAAELLTHGTTSDGPTEAPEPAPPTSGSRT